MVIGGNGTYGRRDTKATIIVRAHENPDLTGKCLKSISENTDRADYSLILIDQEGVWLDHGLPITRCDYVVLTDENTGAVRATNMGLQLALLDTSEFVIVLDNDVEIPNGDTEWLTRLLAHFDDERVGAAGATSDYVTGDQNIAQTPRSYTKEAPESNEGGPAETGPLEAAFLISFACAYRKNALRGAIPAFMGAAEIKQHQEGRLKLNESDMQSAYLWDERYEPGNSEDLDISLRLRLRGWKLVIARDVYIHHVGSQAFKAADQGFNELLQANQKKFIEKWGADILVKYGFARPVAEPV